MPKINREKPRGTKPKGVIGRIRPIGFSEEMGIKVNIYGRSGTGKTTLWATFPGPILAIICSGGSQPGELRSIDTPAYRKKIKQIEIRDSSEIREVIDYQKNGAEFKTIVLDHSTGLQDMILKEILGLEELPAQKSWGIATQQQYGQRALQMKEILRGLLSLSCNVVIVAQEQEFNTEDRDDEGRELITPYVAAALSDSVGRWFHPAVDYILQTFIRQKTEEVDLKIGENKTVKRRKPKKGVDYCLRTAPDPVYTVKFRVPKRDLPEVIVDPTYEKVIRLIKGG